MKTNKLIIITIIIIVSIIIFNDSSFAKDYASFKSFYKESMFKSWVIGGTLAVAGVVLVFITTGAAAPFVGTIGSAIGGLMGLSGAAATSAGLAWLGGGALAVGGFGVFGGTVLLTAIFEGTILGGTQYINYKMNEKSYAELCEQVKDYPNLPPIVNNSGPEEIDVIVRLFKEHYNLNELPSSKENQDTIRVAISRINKYEPEKDAFYKVGYDTIIRHEQLRINTLKAILHFMANDYKGAYQYVMNARSYHESVEDDGKISVLDFIYAVSGLIAKEIDIKTSLSRFRMAIKAEPDNRMIPLLYSIYISRVGAMDCVSIDFIREIGELCELINDRKIRSIVSIQVATASLTKIWDAQQIIRLISDNSDNLDMDTKKFAEKAYNDYKSFLSYANSFILTIPKSDDTKEFLVKANESLNKYKEELNMLEKATQNI